MSKIDDLLERYEQNVQLPWESRVSGAQRVWFVVYGPKYERELRARINEFKHVTTRSGHGWREIDLTSAFPEWMADHEYRDGYFEYPQDVERITSDFVADVSEKIRSQLREADDSSVVALTGIGTLFGITYVSDVLEEIQEDIRGRLAVFFPGRRDHNTYRLLDARDGWDYLAVPITA